MGTLLYGQSSSIEIDDRALAHLQIVIVAKLRRSEAFAFTWIPDSTGGEGRRVIWVSPSQLLQFQYHGSRLASINREWVGALMVSANSSGGLHIVPEPNAQGVGSESPSRALSHVP
jgi:hypothetical protein